MGVAGALAFFRALGVAGGFFFVGFAERDEGAYL
jgi:hypothetical protein